MTTLPPEQVVERVVKRLSEPTISKDALVKLLKKAEIALSELTPCASLQAALTSLSCSLVQNNMLKHKDDDVRLLVAVCFTEIIRLLAPNPPCSYEVFKDFFRIIVSVFKNLTDTSSPYSTRRLKILETVAYCKSFLIMLGGCEDLAAEMFDVFFKAVRCKIQKSLVQAILSIMTSILEQQVAPRILFVILHNLLGHEKAASFRLAVSVIQDCAPKLEASISSFLTSCILDKDIVDKSHGTDCGSIVGDDDEHDDIFYNTASATELQISYHEIIHKIYQYAPHILTSMLPILTQELLIDQVDARLKAVQLIGKLLVLSKLSFGQEQRPIFSEFLRRFSDKSTEVRLTSLEWAKAGYQANNSADESRRILVAVEGRLLDFDDKVRARAISVICNLASSNLSYFPSELVLKAIKRLRDKKISVRKCAMQSLLELYRVYCIKCFNGLSTLNFDYENIPCAVLMLCFDKDCKEFRSQNMELVLGRDLFPSSLSITDRTNHWIALFSLLTQPQLKALKFILVQKRRLQLEMQTYLALRDIGKENNSDEGQIKLFESFPKMATSFLDFSKAKECLQKLHEMKDGYIFKLLKELVDEHTTLTAANSIRVAFLERIGKKHPDYDFFRILSLKCSYTIFNAELVRSILEDILSRQSSGDKSVEYSAELLIFIVKMFPSLLKGSEDLLLRLLLDDTASNEKLLHILALAGQHVSIKLSDVYPFLEKMCLLGTRVESKFAVLAISSLIKSSDDATFSKLCQKLVRSLQSCQNIPTILQSLCFVARHSFRTYKPHEKQVTDFIIQDIFGSAKVHCALDETLLNGDFSCSRYCKLKIYGMKALVKSFLQNRGSQVSKQIKETMNILETTIQGEGIIYNNISSEIEKDYLRLTAAKLLLQFAARFDTCIPPKLFHLIIARARDPSYTVRKSFLRKVHELLKENLIPFRYACSFALACTDFIGDVRADSIKYLAEFIEGRHRYSFNQNSSTEDEKGQIVNSPEYIVVFLIHVLAHDQGFLSESLEDKDFYPEFCSPLVIILRVLVDLEDISGKASDTLSNLFAILRAIKKADDAVDAHITPKLHVLSDIAMLILKSLVNGLKPSSNLRRMIFLPSSFYKVCEDPSKVYDLGESFMDENFANRILDVVDSSIIKPCSSGSKQCGKPKVGPSSMGAMKDYSDNLFQAEGIKPLALESELLKDPNCGNVLDKASLQKRTSSVQPFKTYPSVGSVSTNSHNENADVYGRRNLIPQIFDASLGDEQLSSCNSASTESYFPGLQTLTTEPEVEVLNPLLTKQRITKCDFIPFRCDQNPFPNNCLTSKEYVQKREGLVGHRVCICSPIDMCSCSGTVDSCDSQQNRYKVSYDNKSVDLSHLKDERWESVVQKPSMDEDPCGVQLRDSDFVKNTSNMQTTVLGGSAGNYEHFNSSAIVGTKKTKRQRPAESSAMTRNCSKSDMVIENAARRTRPRRA